VNRSVPTLLGIVIILLVVALVVLIYNLRLTTALARGETVVGTVGGRAMTGVETPEEVISPIEALGAPEPAGKAMPAEAKERAPQVHVIQTEEGRKIEAEDRPHQQQESGE
jgi:hypothetical protein